MAGRTPLGDGRRLPPKEGGSPGYAEFILLHGCATYSFSGYLVPGTIAGAGHTDLKQIWFFRHRALCLDIKQMSTVKC